MLRTLKNMILSKKKKKKNKNKDIVYQLPPLTSTCRTELLSKSSSFSRNVENQPLLLPKNTQRLPCLWRCSANTGNHSEEMLRRCQSSSKFLLVSDVLYILLLHKKNKKTKETMITRHCESKKWWLATIWWSKLSTLLYKVPHKLKNKE